MYAKVLEARQIIMHERLHVRQGRKNGGDEDEHAGRKQIKKVSRQC